MKTIILRHVRENLRKCSLRGLEKRDDLIFYTYPVDPIPKLDGYILLKVGAPPLTALDAGHGLLVIDATWRLAAVMSAQVERAKLEERSLPAGFKTAYPRRQTACPDPEAGLASVEALYLAYAILGKNTAGLLDGYYWREEFLRLNEALLK